ncbi:hypothetical protein [Flavobacterium sp. H122]|uniref:hypothetical protein n=1 Tax=Flavobacterium sp. H122 TaxID=2529860 RepID=UPI0010AB1017|nr:hypothetical protein [Flavobacterium sp. H122]
MNRNFYLLCFASFLSILFLIIGRIEGWHFEKNYYLGLCLITINFPAFFFIKKYFNYILGLTLLLGLSGLIYFFPFKMGLSFFGITIQAIPLLFIIIFSYINRSKLLDFLTSSDIKSEEEKLESIERKKNIFRKEFERLSDSELTNKLNQNLIPEANEVINEILEYRKATQ